MKEMLQDGFHHSATTKDVPCWKQDSRACMTGAKGDTDILGLLICICFWEVYGDQGSTRSVSDTLIHILRLRSCRTSNLREPGSREALPCTFSRCSIDWKSARFLTVTMALKENFSSSSWPDSQPALKAVTLPQTSYCIPTIWNKALLICTKFPFCFVFSFNICSLSGNNR